MGFLKKIFIYYLLLILVSGCASSLIKVNSYKDVTPHSQFGKFPIREFYYKLPISLSLTEKWEAEINGGFSNSSVTVYDSAVFVNDLSGRIYCFSIADGKTLGQLKYKGSIFTTPIIQNSLIIFAVVSDKENISTLYFYDYKEGKEISSIEIEGRVTNQLLKLDDGIILLSEMGHLYRFDFTGNLIWHYEATSFCHSSPVSNNKVIIFGNDNGEIISIDRGDVLRNNNPDSKLIFREKIGGPFFSGAIIFDNEIYIGNEDGNLYSIDLNSGNVNWSFQSGAKIKMEAVVNENEIFVGNLKGDLFKLSRLDGKQIWKVNTGGLLNITPLLTKNVVIVPDANKKIYLISVSNGEIVDSLLFDGRLKLNPVIKNNLLFVGYENGNLRAYEIFR